MKLLGTNKILECQTVLKKLEACCRSQWICTYSSPVCVFPAKALPIRRDHALPLPKISDYASPIM